MEQTNPALTEAALIHLTAERVLRVEGRDRVAWLHKLTTADVQRLGQGSGAYGLLLNAKGHVVADFTVLVQPDALVLYTSATAQEKLAANLRRAIFREKVRLSDPGDPFAVYTLQGPRSVEVFTRLGWNMPAPPSFHFVVDGDCVAVRRARAGTDGFDFLVPHADASALRDGIVAAGARAAGIEVLDAARVEAGIPWYGADFDESMLAPEARLDPFIAENKGCYTGQEVIARIRNRGHVNRLLVQFQLEGTTVPARGDRVLVGDAEIGWVTSPAWSIARGAPVALGYTRREWTARGTRVEIEHAGARLAAHVTG